MMLIIGRWLRSERKETKSLDEFVRTGMEKMFNRLDNGDKERYRDW